jgi:diguanylate cyclase (GGDEF)-like protein
VTEICLPVDMLDALLPMALVFDPVDGRICHAGPMLDRIAPDMAGQLVGEVIDLVRPSGKAMAEGLLAMAGRRLIVTLRNEACGHHRDAGAEPRSRLRAVVARLSDGRGLLTMSFGADVLQAVGRHDLSAQDFSALDPTIDLLFLAEARDAVLTEFRRQGVRLEEARADAELLAQTDKLTGLPNRRALDRRLAELTCQRGGRFGLMHMDLDHFKAINDSMGHAAGDHVLGHVAAILREEVRGGDMVSRVGGDEFVLLFPGCDDVEVIVRIGERIIARLERPIAYGNDTCRISGSVGITLSEFYEAPGAERMLADADQALYASKAAGRARVTVASLGPKSLGAPFIGATDLMRRREAS